MAPTGHIEPTTTMNEGSSGCGTSASASASAGARTAGGRGGGRGGGAGGPGNGPPEHSRGRAGAASCRFCIHKDVCTAYEAALRTNDTFAAMRFIKMDAPIVNADRLAERCAKFTPPKMVGLSEELANDLR